jgi:hypothetical protein
LKGCELNIFGLGDNDIPIYQNFWSWNWDSPQLDFAYSQGKPAGQSRKSEEIFCPSLLITMASEDVLAT